MTGQELINWIIANHLEDYNFGVDREPCETPDMFYSGFSAEVDSDKKTVII